jgi:hypothetical protein
MELDGKGDITCPYDIGRQVTYQAAEFVVNAEIPNRKEKGRPGAGDGTVLSKWTFSCLVRHFAPC